ncbi:MAG: monovalent cation/H+ antiporter complex subunit F [Ilumatobacteraceae bacterium]
MTAITVIAYAMLSIGALSFIARLALGPTLPDRVLALDGFASTLTVGVVVAAFATGSAFKVTIVLVLALVGFVGAGVMARFVERRGG